MSEHLPPGQKAGRRVDAAKRHDPPRCAAGFLFQLAHAASLNILALAMIELARRDLEQHVGVGVAALADDIHLPIGCQGHYAGAAADVVDHLPGGFPAVRQGHGVYMDGKDPAFKNFLLGEGGFH